MGCTFPKLWRDRDDIHQPNIFKVLNVDQDGNGGIPGKIELTSEYLILHQNKKESISWPIRTLRRYGYETGIFSFESGRRCPTGAGIFAFKCEKAEQLFKMLQTNIQRSCGNLAMTHNDSDTANHYLEPRVVNVRQFRLESIGSTSSCPPTPVSPVPPTTPVQLSINEAEVDSVTNKEESNDNANKMDSLSVKELENQGSLYINVTTGEDSLEETTIKHSYTNILKSKHFLPPISLPPMDEETSPSDESSPRNLQYVVLELDSSKPSSPVNKTPTQNNGLPEGYTTIDFKRTQALVQSTKPNIENDIGCKRRTRHNSDITNSFHFH